MKKLYLHLGMHKTATSYIQNKLFLNRKILSSIGLIYLETGLTKKAGTGRRHLGVSRALEKPSEVFSVTMFDNLKNEINKFEGKRGLISHERLFSPKVDPENISLFYNGQIDSIVYIRNPIDYMESKYKQFIENQGVTSSPFEFTKKHESFLDYTALVKKWREAKNINMIKLCSFEKERSDIFKSFNEFLGIEEDISNLLEEPKKTNPSIDANIASLYLKANSMFLGKGKDVKKIRKEYIANLLKDQNDFKKSSYRVLCDDSIDFIKDNYLESYISLLDGENLEASNSEIMNLKSVDLELF